MSVAFKYACFQVFCIPTEVLQMCGGVYIIKSVFMRICDEGGYNAVPLLSWLNDRGLIERNGKNMTVPKRIGGILTRCVHLTMCEQDEEELPDL